ncbi:FixH family protein [Sporosarcina sp.]|uniref:FixH family protein n=1 Tax=Sporosarcina sp. TaxID=49982 RepID=UPI002635C937|nr:FixH family protein [Sporosarcina sp.]
MKRFGILFMAVAMTGALAACSQEEDVPTDAELPEILEVELTVPEQAEAGESVELSALVTQGDEKVDDASEVSYEVWEDGKKDTSIHIESTNENDGRYTAIMTFDHDALYTVQVHVTAREMHIMPEKQIQIGEASAHHDAENEHHDSKGEHHEHGQTAGLAIHFMQPEDTKVKTDTELMTHVALEGAPLENTHVRYEIADPDNEIKWVETDESKPGEYIASYQFPKAGKYNVTIHIKSDTLHEHEKHVIEVK